MRQRSIVLLLAEAALLALLGCAFLASASAAQPDAIAVKTSSADEYAPASQGDWLSWTQASHAHPNRPNVFVQNGTGPKIKVNAPGTKGEESSIDGQTLVYYEWKGDSAGDIRRFDLLTRRRSNFPAKVSTVWDEYGPTISGPWLLFTRYIDRTRTTKVLLYNMQTHALRTLGTARGRQRWVYAGQVSGDYAAWGRVQPGGQDDVYLYRISTRTNTAIPRPVGEQYNPAVTSDGTIYFGRSGDTCGKTASLVRYAPGGVTTVLHDFPAGTDVGYIYTDERTDGSLQVLFNQVSCRSHRSDIYKVVDSFTYSISKAGTGTGTVTSDPAGIDCGTACQSIFHGGLLVTLTAAPDPGSVFSGWSDSSCGMRTTCAVRLESDFSLQATFDPSP